MHGCDYWSPNLPKLDMELCYASFRRWDFETDDFIAEGDPNAFASMKISVPVATGDGNDVSSCPALNSILLTSFDVGPVSCGWNRRIHFDHIISSCVVMGFHCRHLALIYTRRSRSSMLGELEVIPLYTQCKERRVCLSDRTSTS